MIDEPFDRRDRHFNRPCGDQVGRRSGIKANGDDMKAADAGRSGHVIDDL